MTSQPTAEVFQRDRDPLGNNDFIQVRQNTVNKLWCHVLAVKMWAEIKHTHRVPVTGCQNIDSLFTVELF